MVDGSDRASFNRLHITHATHALSLGPGAAVVAARAHIAMRVSILA